MDTEDLPLWSFEALAAIGGGLLRLGHLAQGRRILDQVAAQTDNEEYPFFHLAPSLELVITTQADAGDYAGVILRVSTFPVPLRSEALIILGETQAEAGDSKGALQTFEQAILASVAPDELGFSTSLADIGLGAAYAGKVATVQLILERLSLVWMSKYFEEAQRWGKPQHGFVA